MNRRSFFGVVVAGASSLVLPRQRVKEVPVKITMRITYEPSMPSMDEIRKSFVRQLQDLNDKGVVFALPHGVERVEWVRV